MTDLSPAAQAVLDASSNAPVGDGWNADRLAIAAALRAAADQVFTKQRLQTLASKGGEPYVLMTWAKDQFDAIATELEAQSSFQLICLTKNVSLILLSNFAQVQMTLRITKITKTVGLMPVTPF